MISISYLCIFAYNYFEKKEFKYSKESLKQRMKKGKISACGSVYLYSDSNIYFLINVIVASLDVGKRFMPNDKLVFSFKLRK